MGRHTPSLEKQTGVPTQKLSNVLLWMGPAEKCNVHKCNVKSTADNTLTMDKYLIQPHFKNTNYPFKSRLYLVSHIVIPCYTRMLFFST